MNDQELTALLELMDIATDYCVEYETVPARADDVWRVVRVLENYLDRGGA